MKKKFFGILISALVVASLLGGCAKSNNLEVNDTTSTAQTTDESADNREYDNPYQGIKFTLPDLWYSGIYEKKNIVLESYDYGLSVSYLTSNGMEILENLQDSISKLPEDATSYTDEQNTMIEDMYKELIPVGLLLSEYDGANEAELRSGYTDAKELGKSGLTVYTLLYDETPDMSKFADSDKDEYQAIWSAMFEIENDIVFSGYKSLEQLKGDIQFDSSTIDGVQIDTTIFVPYKLTAINIWATWCNPCVAEMPELQEVYESLPEGVNLLGVCLDAAEEPELAKQIAEQTGVKYASIIANEAMINGFLSYIQSFPTTIFVDSEGNLVGEAVVGAPPKGKVAETYLGAIDEHLELLGE